MQGGPSIKELHHLAEKRESVKKQEAALIKETNTLESKLYDQQTYFNEQAKNVGIMPIEKQSETLKMLEQKEMEFAAA